MNQQYLVHWHTRGIHQDGECVTNAGNPTETDAEPGKNKSGSSEHGKSWDVLGDFTATTRLLPISGLALAIGVVAAFVALALLPLIGLFTNLFYFGRWSTALVSPSGNHLGIFAVSRAGGPKGQGRGNDSRR